LISQDFIIQNKVGLHARPASQMVKKASQFKSKIELRNGDGSADAKSIISLISLGAGKGAKISIAIDGEDEKEAMEAILKVLSELED